MDLEGLTERLWRARQAGDYAPAWLNGSLDLSQALEVQLGLLERELEQGAQQAGWKVGLTSERARRALGVDERPFGYVLRHLQSEARLPTAELSHPSIEPELCFLVGRRIAGPRRSRQEVARAMARVAAGFEINERRPGSARPDFCSMVTDCLTQWGVVEGDGVAFGDAPEVAGVRCTLHRDGEQVYAGVSRDELDDHLGSLSRLATILDAHGRALEPGQLVITGAYSRFDVRAGQHWRADYEGIGSVEVDFT